MIKTNGRVITVELPEGDASHYNQEELIKIIQAELVRQERVHRESQCKECKGAGQITEMHTSIDSIESDGRVFGSGGYSMRYCECEAGMRRRREQMTFNQVEA